MAAGTLNLTGVQGTITLIDGAGTELVVGVDRGDLSYGPIASVLNEDVITERRGNFFSLNYGARIYPELAFSAFLTQFTSATTGEILDFVLKRGSHAGLVSTLGTGAKVPFCLHVKFALELSDYVAGLPDQNFTAQNCRPRVEQISESMDGSSFNLAFKQLGNTIGSLAVAEIAR